MKTKEKENSSPFILKEILSDGVPPHAPSALCTLFRGDVP